MIDELTQGFIADVKILAEQLLRFEEMNLVDVEYRREPGGWVLRVFVDKEEGVTIDDCAIIGSQLGDILDAKMDHDEPYNLEVSSPGLNRPLTKPEHFIYFEGRRAVIKTNRPVEGKRHFEGVLAGFSEGEVKLLVDKEAVAIPYEAIAKARLSIENVGYRK
jgi:ribosome maturation factor RimP